MRRLLPAAAAGVAAAAALALGGAAPAAGKVFSGIVPDVPSASTAGGGALGLRSAPGGGGLSLRPAVGARSARAASGGLPYGGGPVMHSNRTHLIFWAPSGSGLGFDPGYISLTIAFMKDVALDSHDPGNVYGLSGQYTDSGGPAAYASAYRGAVLDSDPLPQNGCTEPPVTGPPWVDCVNDAQIEQEIERVVATQRLVVGPQDIFFLLTPDGLGSCETTGPTNCALGGSAPGSYCGYHSTTSDDTLLYAVIPYNAVSGHCQSDNPRPNGSTADPTLSTLSHEHNETVTDPLGNAYIDSSGNEDGDLCISEFGPPRGGSGDTQWNELIGGGHFYLQEEWSNENGGCRPRADANLAWIRAQRLRRSTVRLGGHARVAHGSELSFEWAFGDGRVGRGRLVTHRYARPGTYHVLLRVTDSARNWTYATRLVVVRRG